MYQVNLVNPKIHITSNNYDLLTMILLSTYNKSIVKSKDKQTKSTRSRPPSAFLIYYLESINQTLG